MSNPEGPGHDAGPVGPDAGSDQPDTLSAEQYAEPETEVLSSPDAETEAALPSITPGERRFTAPSGMDAGSTQIIDRTPDPATEIIDMGAAGLLGGDGSTGPRTAVPQEIPPRSDGPKPRLSRRRGSWGWVLAVVLVIAALAAVAILGTLLLSRRDSAKASQQDLVRTTIHSFDGAIQKGDLATLRSITCGETADSYNKLRRPQVGRHPRPGGRGPAVSGGGQHRRGRRQRRPRRGQRDVVHGVRSLDAVHPQLRSGVPRRAMEDLPGPRQLAGISARSVVVSATNRAEITRCQLAETLRPALCRSLQASMTRSVIPASAFFR